ncbi:MAG: hypothetical protein ACREOS_03050, partial [Candidatus Dormibacteraceae bacterium]
MPEARLNVWMDVMRHLEPVISDHERLFDAWSAGGVTGLVIGPMAFEGNVAAFDPDPGAYRRFGVGPPPAPAEQLPDRRLRLEHALRAAKDRGWQVWIFQPGIGAPPSPNGYASIVLDNDARRRWCARIVDTMSHYPMADGAVLDGPEWGYEISPSHMIRPEGPRSYIFDDLPASAAPTCAALGYDYAALVGARDRLFARLHALNDREVRAHGGRDGGLLGGFALFGRDPDLFDWLAFRIDSLTASFAAIRETTRTSGATSFQLAVGPRSAGFAPLCGYDLSRLGAIVDLLLPKHYFWHRGFDGMYGTIARFVETLTAWSPGLSEAAALEVAGALFGLDLPEIHSLADFDAGFPPAFFDQIVAQETSRALAAVGDPERVVPWIDAGRRPHDGDPVSAGDLGRILDAAAGVGLRR